MLTSAEWMFILAMFLPPAAVVIGLAGLIGVSLFRKRPKPAAVKPHVQAA